MNTESDDQIKRTQERTDPIDAGARRRRALKQILAGTGTVVTAAAIKGQWSTPVIESVVLPAHAQTTGGIAGGFVVDSVVVDNGILQGLVTEAWAAPCMLQLCININANGNVSVQEVEGFTELSTGNGSLNANSAFTVTVQPSGSTISGQYNAGPDNVTGTYSGCGTYPFTAPRTGGSCDLSGSVTTTPAPTTTSLQSTTPAG